MQKHPWVLLSEGGVADGDSDTTSKLTVETTDNHVYFYAYADSDRVLALLKSIREIDATLRKEHISRAIPDLPPTPIWLHINSAGGSLLDAFSAADQLAMIQTPVYSVVEGVCASAATLLSLGCTKRFILPNAFMLIHALQSGMWGKYQEFKDRARVLDMIMEKMIGFYVRTTKLSEEQVRKCLERDSWFNAEQCVELGLADEILMP